MEINDRINQKRLELGLSLHDLVMATGIQEQTLRTWDNGTRVPRNPDRIGKLATALGVTTDWLITGKG